MQTLGFPFFFFFLFFAGPWLALAWSRTVEVPGSKSNLVSFHEDVRNYTSDLSEMKLSDKKGAAEKRTMTLIKKNVCHDSVYINAAKIFQGIRNKKPKDRMLVRYGDESVSPMLTLKDEYSQRLSYELAFSALKCKYKTFPRIVSRNDVAERSIYIKTTWFLPDDRDLGGLLWIK